MVSAGLANLSIGFLDLASGSNAMLNEKCVPASR
jgi:hypothetical protein